MSPPTKPSSNWLALQKSFTQHNHSRKRRKIDHDESRASLSLPSRTSVFPRNASSPPPKRHGPDNPNELLDLETTEVKNGESIAALRKMVLGKLEYKTSQTTPGKYIALDCEMVGIGIEGNESSLARVSIVNYTGAIILDVFVRQRERVVDYRTQWSGVRSTDLAGSAKSFKEVQQTVADLIKDRMLVGHAIYNDLKALLLSHPSPQIRDTQSLAYKHRVVKSRRPALRVLVKQELGIVIQGGEHNSVTDARATMALFRLHKKQWESSFRSSRILAHAQSKCKINDDPASKTAVLVPSPSSILSLVEGRKRKHSESSKLSGGGDEASSGSSSSSRPRAHSSSPLSTSHARPPTHLITTLPKRLEERNKLRPQGELVQRKGVSSGLSTVTRRVGGKKEVPIRRNSVRSRDGGERGSVVEKKASKVGEKWWESLGDGKRDNVKLNMPPCA